MEHDSRLKNHRIFESELSLDTSTCVGDSENMPPESLIRSPLRLGGHVSPPFPDSEPSNRSSPTSLLFRLTAIAAAVFIVTILALVSLVFGDTQSPAARWLHRHAGGLIATEVIAVLVLGFAAMADDRKKTLCHQKSGDSLETPRNERHPATVGKVNEHD